MTDQEREAMQLALEAALKALEAALSDDKPYIVQSKDAVQALRAAMTLAQESGADGWRLREVLFEDGEPIAHREPPQLNETDPCPWCVKGGVCRTPKCGRLKLQQAKPPQREQVLLTEEEIERIAMTHQSLRQVARAVEKASWEKNHGKI